MQCRIRLNCRLFDFASFKANEAGQQKNDRAPFQRINYRTINYRTIRWNGVSY